MEDTLTFERSEDWELIRQIAVHPKVWPMITDDLSPAKENWQPVRNPEIWYVIPRLSGKPMGLFVFLPENPVCWRSHVCILPEFYGTPARIAFGAAFTWLWEHTKCQRIIGSVPLSNQLAVAFAIHSGMKTYGTNPKSVLRNGHLEDQILVGISKPEAA